MFSSSQEKLITSLYDTLRFDYNKNKEEYWSLKHLYPNIPKCTLISLILGQNYKKVVYVE